MDPPLRLYTLCFDLFFVFNFNPGDGVHYQVKFQWLSCQDDLFSVSKIQRTEVSKQKTDDSKQRTDRLLHLAVFSSVFCRLASVF